MAKAAVNYACTECGYSAGRWFGKCPGCNAFGSLVEETPAALKTAAAAKPLLRLVDVNAEEAKRISTGVPELDRVLGGGLVPASLVLVGGEPGVGKSTLLLSALGAISAGGRRALLVTGEESTAQVKLRAARLGGTENVEILAETELDAVCATLERERPDVCVIDSIQTLYAADMSSAPGSVGQVREAAGRLLRVAKEQNVATILVGHVTKDGAVAGPRVLEHLVDCVLQFEGDRYHAHRILRATKNRFGSTNELGVFEMTGEGLIGVPDPSELFGKTMPGEVGAAVACVLEGTRPILLEIQALVAPDRPGDAAACRHRGRPEAAGDDRRRAVAPRRCPARIRRRLRQRRRRSPHRRARRRPRDRAGDRVGAEGRARARGHRRLRRDRPHRPAPDGRAVGAAARGVRQARHPRGRRPGGNTQPLADQGLRFGHPPGRAARRAREPRRKSPQIAIIPENHAFSRGFCYTGSRSPVSSRARRLLHGRDDLGEAGLFDVGDKVVYPHHGAGTVVKKEKREVLGQTREYLTIQILHNDMTVNVPVENAEQVGLRTVIDEDLVNTVVKALTAGESEMPKNWNRRFKHNRDKMKTGDIFELAEVVKNLSLRDHEKGLSTGEKQMFVKAKKILASELMYAKAVDEEEAAEWLEGVLAGNGEKPKKKSKAKAAAATA